MRKANNPGCPCCGGSGGTTPTPGCFCSVSNVIHVHAMPPPNGLPEYTYDSAALTYQTRPADLAGTNSAPSAWFSAVIDRDADWGFQYRYYFFCEPAFHFFRLLVIPVTTILPGGTGMGGSDTLSQWILGGPNRTCSPFHLSNVGIATGFIFDQEGGYLDQS